MQCTHRRCGGTVTQTARGRGQLSARAPTRTARLPPLVRTPPPARPGRRARSHDLMTKCGIKDFTMYDVMKPEPKRLRRNLSAVINFAKFREERFSHYVNFSEQTDQLISKKQVCALCRFVGDVRCMR